jgi:hypothetical protein
MQMLRVNRPGARDIIDCSQSITKNVIEQAKDMLILRRDTHIDQLVHPSSIACSFPKVSDDTKLKTKANKAIKLHPPLFLI